MTRKSSAKPRFLVDTNVWIDYFIDRSVYHDDAIALVATSQSAGIDLFSTIEATKDVFYLVSYELKRMRRDDGGEVSAGFANAVNEAAWSCLTSLRKRSTVVGADSSDMIEAMTQRANHADYEDNLLVAAAMRARATHIVSSDKQLQTHSPVPCISIKEACALIA